MRSQESGVRRDVPPERLYKSAVGCRELGARLVGGSVAAGWLDSGSLPPTHYPIALECLQSPASEGEEF